MPTIRIDDEVWEELKLRAVPLEDTPNSVLRVLLKLEIGKGKRKSRQPARQHGAAQVEGGTPRHEFRAPILRALSALGGAAQEGKVLAHIEQQLADQLTEVDRAPIPGGRDRDILWKVAAREERRIMARKGLVKQECPKGIWELTEEGLVAAERLSR
ncbi:MAG: hypothetical protein ACETWG_11085 [Candidatus Neomarinimicrobiota bacterium]